MGVCKYLKITPNKVYCNSKFISVIAMATAKEAFLNTLEQLPDDSSYDELLEELALKKMIDTGLSDVDSGKIISNKEMKDAIDSWSI